MEMRKCLNGHYYDASIHTECPYCKGQASGGVTMPLSGNSNSGDDRTMPMGGQQAGSGTAADNGRTMPLFGGNSASVDISNQDDGRTVAIIRQDMGIDPVVGWLVCTEGKEKGRDYRIHSDNNFLGRSEKMDICIRGDETISRENHVVISYDTIAKIFYCSPGDGRSIVRLNNQAIFQTTLIKAYDKVTVGKTVLMFIPLCGKEFEWKDDADGAQ